MCFFYFHPIFNFRSLLYTISVFMEHRSYKILLADYAGFDSGLEVPYMLKQFTDCEVSVFCAKNSWILQNSYWDIWHKAPHSEEDFARELIHLVKAKEYDWVILLDDPTIRIMNDYITDSDLFYKILPLADIKNRAVLGSKSGLSIVATTYGISTPAYAIYNGTRDPETIAEEIGYPLILKIDKSEGGTGVYLCQNKNELRACFDKLTEPQRENLLLQQYIKGLSIAGEALYHQGELLAYACSEMTKYYGSAFGLSITRTYTPKRNQDLEPDLIKLGRSMRINGFANITYIFDPLDQKYYFIELDPRPHSWFFLDRHVGVDFSKAIHNFLTGVHEIIRPNIPEGESRYVIHFVRDIMYSIKTLDLRNLAKWAFNTDGRWDYIPLHDRATIWAHFANMPSVLWNKLLSLAGIKRN